MKTFKFVRKGYWDDKALDEDNPALNILKYISIGILFIVAFIGSLAAIDGITKD